MHCITWMKSSVSIIVFGVWTLTGTCVAAGEDFSDWSEVKIDVLAGTNSVDICGPIQLDVRVTNVSSNNLKEVPPLQLRWEYLKLRLHHPNGKVYDIEKLSENASYYKSGYTKGLVFRELEPGGSIEYRAVLAVRWSGQTPRFLFDSEGEYIISARFYNKARTKVATIRGTPFAVVAPHSIDGQKVLEEIRANELIAAEVFGSKDHLNAPARIFAKEFSDRFPERVHGKMAFCALVRDGVASSKKPKAIEAYRHRLSEIRKSCRKELQPDIDVLTYQCLKAEGKATEATALAKILVERIGHTESAISKLPVQAEADEEER